jgi:transcription elongation factor SPT6
MMTDADDIIRAIDIPERMQIAQAGIHSREVGPVNEDGRQEVSDLLLEPEELDAATRWISTRISERANEEYIYGKDGLDPPLLQAFQTAVREVLKFLCCDYFEVPFIWVHRRDFFIHHDPDAPNPADRSRLLLNREDLWKIYSLAIKYRAMLDRKAHLLKLWNKMQADDQYFSESYELAESAEEVADLVEFISLKYQGKLKELAHRSDVDIIPEDAEVDAVRNGPDGVKYKRATSASKYEKAKNSMVARFAEVSRLYRLSWNWLLI